MCAINHLVANKNSACLPCICQWRLHLPSMCLSLRGEPSLCFIRVAVSGTGETLLRQPPPPPGPLWAQPPRAAFPAHTHTRGRSRGHSGGCSRVLAAGCAGRPARAGSRSTAYVGVRLAPPGSRAPRATAARSSPCRPPPPPAGPRAPAPPQSLGKQRPGAILGREGRVGGFQAEWWAQPGLLLRPPPPVVGHLWGALAEPRGLRKHRPRSGAPH